MDLLIKLGLLMMGATVIFAEVRFYVPQVTVKQVFGRLTNNSFALDEPQCIFQQYNSSDVWLVIALDNVVPNLTVHNLSSPSDYNLFKTKKYYHLYQKGAANFPCFDMAPARNALIPVGIQFNCNNFTFCNGILTDNGPYRVKFILLDSNKTLIQETRWSEKFRLQTGINRDTIDTLPAGRSAGMIIIVVILSVLLAFLLAFLIAALVTGSKDVCWCRVLDNEFLGEELDYFPRYQSHRFYSTHSGWFNSQQNKTSVYTVFK